MAKFTPKVPKSIEHYEQKEEQKGKAEFAEMIDKAFAKAAVAREALLERAHDTSTFDAKAHSTYIGVDTKVGYSVQFLKSIGQAPTGEMCHWRGVVREIRALGDWQLATVEWDHGDVGNVNIKNLAPVGPNRKFCNVD